MDEQKFWAIVQQAHQQSGGDMVEKCELVTVLISALSREEAIGSSYFFDTMMDRAYSWSLWGAAYVIHGGCGEDTFSDFRATLISSGRQVFKRTLADPGSLAANDFDEDSRFYEGWALINKRL